MSNPTSLSNIPPNPSAPSSSSTTTTSAITSPVITTAPATSISVTPAAPAATTAASTPVTSAAPTTPAVNQPAKQTINQPVTPATTETAVATSTDPVALPAPQPIKQCYCGDPSIQSTDLVCSAEQLKQSIQETESECFITHSECLRTNEGRKFHEYALNRSIFLCANCVRNPNIKKAIDATINDSMVCTLDSTYGCFYEMPENVIKHPDGRITVKNAIGHRQPNQSINQSQTDHQHHSQAAPFPHHGHNHSNHIMNNQLTIKHKNDADVALPPEIVLSGEEDNEPKRKRRTNQSNNQPNNDKKKKTKLVPRCTSPSHFYVETGSSNLGFPAVNQFNQLSVQSSNQLNPRLVDKLRTDSLLHAVSCLYARPRPVDANSGKVSVSNDYDRLEYSTFDMLTSPLRAENTLDEWSPIDIALFEAGICAYGKDFHEISRLMEGRKTCNQCVEFYYLWKKSAHYALWKECGKPIRKRAEAREQQWQVIKEKMDGVQTVGANTPMLSNNPNKIITFKKARYDQSIDQSESSPSPSSSPSPTPSDSSSQAGNQLINQTIDQSNNQMNGDVEMTNDITS